MGRKARYVLVHSVAASRPGHRSAPPMARTRVGSPSQWPVPGATQTGTFAAQSSWEQGALGRGGWPPYREAPTARRRPDSSREAAPRQRHFLAELEQSHGSLERQNDGGVAARFESRKAMDAPVDTNALPGHRRAAIRPALPGSGAS